MLRLAFVLACATLGLGPTPGVAQGSEADSRYPESGIAILNCAPGDPAPENSCTLRVPPGHKARGLKSDPTGDKDAEFQFARSSSSKFPDDVTMSATILLVDLSPGPNRGRARTFAAEKAMIAEVVEGLPATESVAIYGFNERLVRLQDFTTRKSSLLDTVDDLELGGSNTLIGTFVSDSISILTDRDDVLFRNILLVSDGDDEGGQPVSEVAALAVENQVIVSTLGSFWRSIGSSQNGAGIAYMRALAQDTMGVYGQAPLQNPTEAGRVAGEFVQAYQAALRDSGLILPVGDVGAADISVTLEEPVLGQSELEPRNISVSFEPKFETPPEDEAEEEAEPEGFPWGYPEEYVYGAGGIGALLLLLLLFLLFRRRGRDDDEPEIADIVAADPEPFVEDTIVSEAPTEMLGSERPGQRASAYLVFEDGRERGAIIGQRVNIGRSKSNEIVIEAEGMSRLHAQIYRNRDGGFSIADMDSLNGTFVNGTKIVGTQPVGLGDTITFGKVNAKLVPA